MELRDLLRKRKNRKIMKAPEVKIGKHWSFEYGNYYDTVNRKPTKDFYFGLKFKTNW